MRAAQLEWRSCPSVSQSKWTRSSPSKADPRGPDPLWPGPAGFAHRGLHHGAGFPENSFIAFAAALEMGCGIECDLRLTQDNRIVLFHDSDCMRICGSPLRIARSRWPDLSRLSVGEHPMPTLESLLKLVAGRVPLLLEVKVENDLWRWSPALRAALSDYRGAFGIMSFDARIPRFLLTKFPGVRRGLVVKDDLSPFKRRLALWFAKPDFLAVDLEALGKAPVARLRRRMPVYGWTVRTARERAQASVHADALIWEDDGRPRD